MYKRQLYVSGEESAHQIKMRASRIGVPQDTLYVLTENEDVYKRQLFEWFPSILRVPLGASVTLSEATAPVKLPT